LKGDSLFGIFRAAKVWLRHRHYDVFDAILVKDSGIDTASMLDPRFNFRTNDAGEITTISLKLEPTLDALTFSRIPVAAPLDEGAIARYAGSYEVGGMVARVFLKGKGLALAVPGQPEYELISTGKDKFQIKGLDGYKVEFVEVAGNYAEAVFIQPNGTFHAKRKD
jgi:hypothetical protein